MIHSAEERRLDDLKYREQLARTELLEIQVEQERERLRLLRDRIILPVGATEKSPSAFDMPNRHSQS